MRLLAGRLHTTRGDVPTGNRAREKPRLGLGETPPVPQNLEQSGREHDSLLDIEDGKITFRWKDYRHNDQPRVMTLQADEFIRRFLLHVLPDGFQRIRHYGFLAHGYRKAKLALCRQLLGAALTAVVPPQDQPDYRDLYEKLTGRSLRECPVCHAGHIVVIAILPASGRPPPLGNR